MISEWKDMAYAPPPSTTQIQPKQRFTREVVRWRGFDEPDIRLVIPVVRAPLFIDKDEDRTSDGIGIFQQIPGIIRQMAAHEGLKRRHIIPCDHIQ